MTLSRVCPAEHRNMKVDNCILVLRSQEISSMLAGREREVIETVRVAYQVDAEGGSVSPHSVFLRFPGDNASRIIAKPASLGAPFDIAGVKWVSSFPANVAMGLNRASAVLVLNSTSTGQPMAVLEGSIISSARTAASAALAAQYLHKQEGLERAGFVGCGPINFETVRYLQVVFPSLRTIWIHDHSSEREENFEELCHSEFDRLEVVRARCLADLFEQCMLLAFATNATEPHVPSLNGCCFGSTLLHISLRDLLPKAILDADNVVDDMDHVCTARTSLHLAELQIGNRDFIRCTLGDVLRGSQPARTEEHDVTVFSPFGMAFLDLAVGRFVLDEALRHNCVLRVESFLPESFVRCPGEKRAR